MQNRPLQFCKYAVWPDLLALPDQILERRTHLKQLDRALQVDSLPISAPQPVSYLGGVKLQHPVQASTCSEVSQVWMTPASAPDVSSFAEATAGSRPSMQLPNAGATVTGAATGLEPTEQHDLAQGISQKIIANEVPPDSGQTPDSSVQLLPCNDPASSPTVVASSLSAPPPPPIPPPPPVLPYPALPLPPAMALPPPPPVWPPLPTAPRPQDVAFQPAWAGPVPTRVASVPLASSSASPSLTDQTPVACNFQLEAGRQLNAAMSMSAVSIARAPITLHDGSHAPHQSLQASSAQSRQAEHEVSSILPSNSGWTAVSFAR